MKVIVFQTGARHNYAIVRFLHEGGYLRRFYTDFALTSGSRTERFIKLLAPPSMIGPLNRRTILNTPSRLVVNSTRDCVVHLANRAFSRPVLKHCPGGGPWRLSSGDCAAADVVYTQYHEGLLYLPSFAKHGAKVVSDVFITPLTYRISDAEKVLFPQWEERLFSSEEKEWFDTLNRTMIRNSAALFCPSARVIADIGVLDPAAIRKCRLIPYASALTFHELSNPVKKRVLFAGSVTLHKGPQYLLEAARLIWKIDRNVKFVVAGSISRTARQQMTAPNVECLGHITREGMTAEFAQADVFAYPTLAEGRAGVVLEAMAAGLPVVTTQAAGVDIVDGKTGFCVAERNAEQLAEAVLKIVNDRELRQAMSIAARKEAQSYDMEAWRERLLEGLRDVHRNAVRSDAE